MVDQWTTAQELALLTSIINLKPVGVHKHFRMINTYHHLLTSATFSTSRLSTSLIWDKLAQLYDLPALDEREDSLFEDEDAEEYWREFELPKPVYGDMMFERRLAKDDDGSGDEMSVKREGTVEDSEGRSSPVGPGRGTRSAGRRKGKIEDVKAEEGGRRSSRGRKSVTPVGEDVEMGEADEDEEESEENEGTEDEKRMSTRSTRRGAKRGRGRRGRRAK
ncbi:hypothetical protein BT93_L4510 [Corymbia citriodora subsp. variegata]|uniref:Chromatin modification-related protein EAF7 n=1 Tax=Corymbia citriodora subsp. variegata TaxID=360336 RepID=A0A8T0CK32_CORYI|nr:hypothetical protein BT93_L4510 [Corymbia citriodora subsp. variegata]